MSVSINTRQAYSEVDEFLNLLSDEQINKIPQKLRDFFKEEKDQNYKKEISLKSPIKNQNLKEETLGIIALLNLQYWCENENLDKDKLIKFIDILIFKDEAMHENELKDINMSIEKVSVKLMYG